MLPRLLLFCSWCMLLAATSQCSCARVSAARDRRRDFPSQAAKLVSRTNPATDELFFHTELGRGVCDGLKVAEKLFSSSTSAANYECRQTPGCTHVTRNAKTRETFLCSGFADVISNASDWVYSVRKSCGPLEKFLYSNWPGDLRESMCEREFLGGCPAWTFSVREPWHTQPATCAICPPEGCPVPKSLRHVDTLSKPLDRFAQSVGRDMRAMNPSVYVRDGKFAVLFRITNQTRCKLPEPVASDDTGVPKSFSSYVAYCELDSTTMAVRTDTLRIVGYNDEVLSHTSDYENHNKLPFQGPEDCRAVEIGSETSWMLCSKYTKFVEFTTQRKTSHEHFTEPNGKKDRSQEQAQFEVKGTRKRLFDVFAEQIDTTRMALLKFDATSSMRITGGVQFDVRFVDREGDPNDDPELYKIMQKNWMLVPTESLSRLTFIVSSFPHSLATCDVSTATCTIRSYARQESAAHLGGQILKQWRGGSMLLRTERGLLSVVHSRTYISTEAMYNHALALYSSHFPHRLISLSEPFRLPQPRKSVAEESGIQFASGIEYDAKSERLFLGYGHSDCSAELAVLHEPFTSIKWHKISSAGEFSQAPRAPRGDEELPKPTHHGSRGTTLVRIAGPVTSTYSLAEVNREFALAVAESGFDLTLRSANWGENVDVLHKSARFGHLYRFLENHLVDAARPAAITIYNNWPVQLFPPLRGQWVWNLAWEFHAIPLSWQEVMKKQEVTVWTPSTFTRDALLRAGVSPQKVKYVPHAVDADDICSQPRSEARSSMAAVSDAILELTTIPEKKDAVDRALKSCSDSGADFIYLYHGAALWRKGLDVLLDSYSSARPGLANTCLIVHASYGDDEVYDLVAKHAVAHAIEDQNLIILTETLSKEELAKLFLSADAIVHPSRAEGFGLVAAQALACNKTLIVTADGATRDFATNETAFLVGGRYAECTKAPCSEIGLFSMEVTSKPTWFEPDTSSLVDAMAEARNNKLLRRKRQAAGYELISKRFNRKNLHRRVQREILDLQNRDRKGSGKSVLLGRNALVRPKKAVQSGV